jgi:hypothetical protein
VAKATAVKFMVAVVVFWGVLFDGQREEVGDVSLRQEMLSIFLT